MKKELASIFLATTILSVGVVAAADQDKPTAGADATFKSLDRDADQRLSKTEVAKDKMLTEHFAAVDADGDGYLTTREYTAHMKEMESAKKKEY
jgi:Ca2+-binding EF-hand superfamily protein